MRRRDALFAAVATAGLSAWGTLPRETFTLVGLPQGEPLGVAGVRAIRAETGRLDVSRLLDERARTAPLSILALSGGGANGSYGAGVLVGWTQASSRPLRGAWARTDRHRRAERRRQVHLAAPD